MKHALEKSAFELRSRLRWPITAGLRLWGATAPRLISVSAALGITLLASSTTVAATSVEQVQASGAFPQPLEWVGSVEPGEAESGALLEVLQTLQSGDQKAGFAGLESFLQGYPQSAWVPSVHVSLAEYYRRFGRYTPALTHWEAAWSGTKASKDPATQKLAVRSFAGWTRLLASLGQKDRLTALYQELHTLQLPLGSYSTTIENTGEGLAMMKSLPGLSYRCGAYALANVAQGLHLEAAKWQPIRDAQSPEGGFHVSQLLQMAQTNGLALEAVRRPAGAEIMVPSVVHWKLNHYAAIVGRKDNRYKVLDPTFEGHVWMEAETIDSEASGVFLVPQGKAPAAWPRLSDAEKASVFGKGAPYYIGDGNDGPHSGCGDGDDEDGDDGCDPPSPNDGPGGGSSTNPPCCTGMPVWSVSEPYTTLWLKDVPLLYRLSNGKWMKLELHYKHRGEDKGSQIGSFGDKWECNWQGLLQVDSATPDVYVNHLAGGGVRALNADGSLEYKSASSLNPAGTRLGPGTGAVPVITWPMGARNQYEQSVAAGGITNYFLTHRVDRYGRYVRFDHETAGSVTRLKYVVDVDGRTNTVYYQNGSFPNLVTAITNAYGQGVLFTYDTSRATPILTNMVDMAGITNCFTYDPDDVITNMVTPYGTTSFQVMSNGIPSGFDLPYFERGLLITEPSGDKQLYEYYDPHKAPGCQSLHWNRAQYAAISAEGKADPFNMPRTDYDKASGKNWWPGTAPSGDPAISDTLASSFEPLDPTLGRRPEHDFYYMEGLKRPIYASTYTYVQVTMERNALGRPTTLTYYNSDGSQASYINTFDASGVNLQTVQGPRGELVRGYGYHPVITNLLTSVTNALGEVIRYTHDTNTMKLITTTLPSGLVHSNVYYSSGPLKGFRLAEIEWGIRTNYFGYQNGNLAAQTNELGVVTTYLYDKLNRLVSTAYPDGTTVSNVYDKLDLVAVKDRMNNWTRYVYNNLRQVLYVTNANGQVTQYEYCNCGSPSRITRWDGAKSLVTSFDYDMAGRRTQVTYPDGYQLNYTYNEDDSVASVTDGGGSQLLLYQAHHGEDLTPQAAYLNGQQLFLKTFDEYGRATNEQARNLVITTNAYDFLGRVVERRSVGTVGLNLTALEQFVYDSRGLASSIDQRGGLTTWVRDTAGRVLYETNANNEVLQYTYNPADEPLTLTDGNGNTTRWNYDPFGRVTNKVDAANNVLFVNKYDPLDRLTNRWSAAKGDTIYRFDALGNLTNVVYTMSSAIPSTTNIVMRYDGFNRLVSMADGIGTTTFAWTDGDQLATEDGPWAMDTVSYSYTNGLRAGMSVLAPNASPWIQNYAYEGARRLSSLFSPAGEFDYHYNESGASEQPLKISVFGTGIKTENGYDDLGRLTNTSLYSSWTKVNEHQYTYDGASQRTQQAFMADDSGQYHYVDYTYDYIGQLKTASGFSYEQDADTGLYVDRPRLQEQFGYAYDKGWNLQYRTNGSFVQTFKVNSVNELLNVTNQGTFTVAGLATERKGSISGLPAGVTNVVVSGTGLSSGSADLYADGTWARPGAVLANGNNSYTAVASDTVGRTDTATVSSSVVSSNSFVYDLNGNLRTNNTRVFDYDGENQLICITEPGQWKSEFYYDGMMRRRIRKEYTYIPASSSYALTNEVHYVYDGMLVVQERDGNNLPQVTYTRGNGLSGSVEDAGGIGGLLARTANPKLLTSSPVANAYYHSDANGNITAMVSGSGVIVGKYLYDPYGNVLASQGALADANTYRFSSKEWDYNSGLYFYGFRFYSPSLLRWLNRDPEAESGGLNLFSFAGGDPVNAVDAYGQCPIPLVLPLIEAAGEALGGTAVVGGVAGAVSLDPDPGDVKKMEIAASLTVKALIEAQVLWSKLRSILPARGGPPNGSLSEEDGKGNGKIRYYDGNGNAVKDIDFGHGHGKPDPHVHDWDWSKNPPRQPGRAPGPCD